MSDRIKEFVNTTYTLADVDTSTNKIVVMLTDATTQAVVKDIAIKNEDIDGTISLNDYEISDTIESMSGSEIVDTESELAFNIPVPFGITLTIPETVVPVTALQNVDISYMTSTTNISQAPVGTVTSSDLVFTTPATPSFAVTGTTLTEEEVLSSYSNVITNTEYVNTFADDFTVAKETCPIIGTTNTPSSTSVGAMSSPVWAYKHTNGNLYYYHYNSNDITNLYYSTNSGASWTGLNSSSYSYKCISPAGRISWVSGTAFYSVEPGGASATGVELSGRITGIYATDTYTHASECNGWHFWMPSNGYTTLLYGYHKDRNTAVKITMNSVMQINFGGGLCVTYNEAENKYFVFSWNSATRHLHRIDTDIEALADDANGTGTGSVLTSGTNINHYASYQTTSQWVPGTKKMMFRDNNTNKVMTTEFSSINPYYTTPVVYADIAVPTGGAVLASTGVDSSFTIPGQVIDAYSYLDTSKTITARVTGVETKLV